MNTPPRRLGMARSQGISKFYLHSHPRSSTNRMNHTCLSFPAEAGHHLLTPEGWQAELAWVAGYIRDKYPAPGSELDSDIRLDWII